MDLFTIELVSNASGEFFLNNTLSSFLIFFTRASKLGGAMGGWNFRNILPINVPKTRRGNSYFFTGNFANLRQPTI